MAYEKQILELMEQEGQGGAPFYLDFSKLSHRQCFYDRYGGEEVLKEEFPELYRLVRETAEASANKAVKGAPPSEQRGNLEDGVAGLYGRSGGSLRAYIALPEIPENVFIHQYSKKRHCGEAEPAILSQ